MVTPNKFVQALSPYEITPQDVWDTDQRRNLLKLDWNEAPYDFEWYKRAAETILKDAGILAWYPDYLALELTKKIADFCKVTVNNLLVFPGSDVALETVCRTYLTETDVVITTAPTYDNFAVFVAQTGATLEKIEVIPPHEVTTSRIADQIERNRHTKMVYLVNPNNPFGYLIPRDVVESLVGNYPEILFVVDEAYIEFSTSDSLVTLVRDYENLVVSRTFSKAFGLAGLRLGYVCAGEHILNSLNKIRNGKNVIMLAQKLGVVALDEIERLYNWVDEVRKAKQMVYRWCDEQSLPYFTSEANFVMLKVPDPTAVCTELKARGIYVRNRDSVLPGYIRVTVGSLVTTKKLLSELSRSMVVTGKQTPSHIHGL